MPESTLISLAFFLLCVLFIMMLIVFTKIKNIQKCIGDVKPKDMYPFLEELRELVIESERVADKLEDAINKKENLLEDLSSLAEEKLRRLETIKEDERIDPYAGLNRQPQQKQVKSQEPAAPRTTSQPQTGQLSIRDRIIDLIQIGMSDAQIASELGVSTTEVQIVRKLEIS